MGVNLCDQRSSLSVLKARFPSFMYESNMTEEDELWTVDHRETHAEQTLRLKEALDEIFASDDSTCKLFTAS